MVCLSDLFYMQGSRANSFGHFSPRPGSSYASNSAKRVSLECYLVPMSSSLPCYLRRPLAPVGFHYSPHSGARQNTLVAPHSELLDRPARSPRYPRYSSLHSKRNASNNGTSCLHAANVLDALLPLCALRRKINAFDTTVRLASL